MRRRRPVFSFAIAVLALGTGSPEWATAQDHSPVMGAWVVEGWSENGQAVPNPLPGLYIFTSTHYSVMFASGDGPRARYEGDEMTDAEMLAAYRTITANSGRYEVAGDQITTRAYVAKDPNYMGSWPDNAVTFTFRMEGNRMHLTFQNGWTVTLRKVEGEAPPW